MVGLGFLHRFVFVLLVAIAPLFAGFDFAPYQAYIDSVIPEVKFGLSVRSVSTGAELLNVNANDYFTPASTMKTLSTATALHFLPLDYAPQTKVSLLGVQQRNVFTGEVNVRKVTATNSSAWRTGTLYFEDTRFCQAIQQLEHVYNVKIHVLNNQYNKQTIRAHFNSNETMEEIMEVFKMLIPSLNYEISGRDIFIK